MADKRGRKGKKGQPKESRKKFQISIYLATGLVEGTKIAIRWFFLWKIAQVGVDAVKYLAGEETIVQVGGEFFELLTPENLKDWIGILTGATGIGGLGYGTVQRHLRKKAEDSLEDLHDSLPEMLGNGNHDGDE